MSAPIKTDWFQGDQKPARPGVYERAMPWGNDEFAKFDGRNWINAATTLEAAAQHTGVSHYQEQPWRGVVPEVLGCIPVEADAENTCLGCYFLDDHVFLGCASACRAVNCSEESIIWRPRAEVQA